MSASTFSVLGSFALAASVVAAVGCDQAADESTSDTQALTKRLGPNDVSILWPVPERHVADAVQLPKGYLKLFPGDGERGPAFPNAAVYDATFPLLAADKTNDAIRRDLIVVGVRVTSCSPSHAPGEGECVPLLRLVAQPLYIGGPAIHVLYQLSSDQLDHLVEDLTTWRDHSPVATGNRLSVHPGLQRAGVDSPFASELSDIVVRYATDAALARITFTTFQASAPIFWTFSQFDRDGDGWKSGQLPTLADGTLSQRWNWAAPPHTPATAQPPTTHDFSMLLGLNGLPAPPDSPEVLAARDVVAAYENPKLTNAETTDCVGCHAASATRKLAEYNKVSFAGSPSSYLAPSWMDASVAPEEAVTNMIAFGYEEDAFFTGVKASISHRVVNETADALLQLGTRHR